MSETGLDRAVALAASTAKAMLDSIGGTWWNVYIGGRFSAGVGWTPDVVRAYAAAGVRRFLPTYVGEQSGGILTAPQGAQDGADAARLVQAFGWAAGSPACLDVEGGTFNDHPQESLAYASAWVSSVRRAGYRPGVYSNEPLFRAWFAGPAEQPDFIWVARWIRHDADPTIDPNQVMPGVFDNRKIWQYAGGPAFVLGQAVDISASNVALAAAPAPGGRVMHISEKRALVRLAYAAFLGRHPTEADLQSWTAKIADDGSTTDQVLTQIQDSPEGLAHEASAKGILTHKHQTTPPQ